MTDNEVQTPLHPTSSQVAAVNGHLVASARGRQVTVVDLERKTFRQLQLLHTLPGEIRGLGIDVEKDIILAFLQQSRDPTSFELWGWNPSELQASTKVVPGTLRWLENSVIEAGLVNGQKLDLEVQICGDLVGLSVHGTFDVQFVVVNWKSGRTTKNFGIKEHGISFRFIPSPTGDQLHVKRMGPQLMPVMDVFNIITTKDTTELVLSTVSLSHSPSSLGRQVTSMSSIVSNEERSAQRDTNIDCLELTSLNQFPPATFGSPESSVSDEDSDPTVLGAASLTAQYQECTSAARSALFLGSQPTEISSGTSSSGASVSNWHVYREYIAISDSEECERFVTPADLDDESDRPCLTSPVSVDYNPSPSTTTDASIPPSSYATPLTEITDFSTPASIKSALSPFGSAVPRQDSRFLVLPGTPSRLSPRPRPSPLNPRGSAHLSSSPLPTRGRAMSFQSRSRSPRRSLERQQSLPSSAPAERPNFANPAARSGNSSTQNLNTTARELPFRDVPVDDATSRRQIQGPLKPAWSCGNVSRMADDGRTSLGNPNIRPSQLSLPDGPTVDPSSLFSPPFSETSQPRGGPSSSGTARKRSRSVGSSGSDSGRETVTTREFPRSAPPQRAEFPSNSTTIPSSSTRTKKLPAKKHRSGHIPGKTHSSMNPGLPRRPPGPGGYPDSRESSEEGPPLASISKASSGKKGKGKAQTKPFTKASRGKDGVERHPCPKGCGRDFSRKDDARRHYESGACRNYTVELTIRCPLCPQLFGRGDPLKRHLRTCHRGEGQRKHGQRQLVVVENNDGERAGTSTRGLPTVTGAGEDQPMQLSEDRERAGTSTQGLPTVTGASEDQPMQLSEDGERAGTSKQGLPTVTPAGEDQPMQPGDEEDQAIESEDHQRTEDVGDGFTAWFYDQLPEPKGAKGS
ncbi:hypothetical protein JAAARDRAFT_62248 [Jaapia argillacea MUCL 33604]|uniref:C2H2-type domain-containing protein n=1 Tax=Jaapia argillacea MUCL 33604 TaxID=933084 RepID=A0A067PLK2_9AGAM|nr:hypothetical protein JAAARDRAFT_62248 [Jaapia argillacea MUCL 33604]